MKRHVPNFLTCCNLLCGCLGIVFVLEGRDIGSVVFPNADIKFFLTAKPEARARRRHTEDQAKGRISTYEQTLAEINERDERDVNRDDSPLTIAELWVFPLMLRLVLLERLRRLAGRQIV